MAKPIKLTLKEYAGQKSDVKITVCKGVLVTFFV